MEAKRTMGWVLVVGGMAAAGCGSARTDAPADPAPTAPAVPPVPAVPTGAPSPDQAPADPAPSAVREETFELTVQREPSYAAGELGQFSVNLTARAGWHVNQDYPTRVELEGPSEVRFARGSLAKADAAEFGDERARFEIPFTPEQAGSHSVRAKVSFAVCTDDTCVPEERTLTVALAVQ